MTQLSERFLLPAPSSPGRGTGVTPQLSGTDRPQYGSGTGAWGSGGAVGLVSGEDPPPFSSDSSLQIILFKFLLHHADVLSRIGGD